MEHKLEVYTEKMRLWEEYISSSLDKVTEAKKLTLAFVESMENANLQDEMRINDSSLEIVDNIKMQSENDLDDMRQLKSFVSSLSGAMNDLLMRAYMEHIGL